MDIKIIKKLKTPITYYGGKQRLVNYLLPLIPEHKLYCEPFFGGGALFFAKPQSSLEVINDINGEVMNFYRMVQLQFDNLQDEIRTTLHSRDIFRQATVVYQNPDMFSPVKRAWAFWTLANQSFASALGSWGAGNDDSKQKSLANKRMRLTSEYADRISTVQIECLDALKVIERCDSADSFFYVDPPYYNSKMAHYKGYSEADYILLLDILVSLKGKFLLSSYPSEILTEYIEKHNWKSQFVQKPIAVTKNTNRKKIEMMIYNYSLTSILK